MNGIHDMGGMHGFGPVVHTEDEPRFHEHWEARVYAITVSMVVSNYFNVDQHRAGVEQMPPADYLRASYFERWLASDELNLTLGGFIDAGDVEARMALLRDNPTSASAGERAPLDVPRAFPPAAPPAPPRFAIGDAVRARNVHPQHHTRLARYVRGKRGVVTIVPGPAVFPDARARGLGAEQQHVYTVRFDAAELWGDTAEPNHTVSIDIWEQYLEAV
jgi:nitrile hydratase